MTQTLPPSSIPPTPTATPAPGPTVTLVKRVICPHCWHTFRPEQVLWISQHEDLMGDAVLKEEAIRFLPTRFTLEGLALDARGLPCNTLACPQCHLPIPRVLLENDITFVSIIGSAGSGKSNLLAAMTWQMRQQLAREFKLIFADGDKETNWILNRYEETLFLPDDLEKPVVLEKTRTQGDLYRSVKINGQETQLPKPFIFSLHPGQDHPFASERSKIGRIICLYDNAGEHYGVGQDAAFSPVTRHLSKAKVLLFLFDPTQDPRFRQRCKPISQDPQILEPLQTVRQETILTEATMRVRKHVGLSSYQRYDRPLIVLVAKSDIWSPLLNADIRNEPIIYNPDVSPLAAMDLARVEEVSNKLRAMLMEVTPEIVTLAEDFSEDVRYVPVSALGHSPEKRDGQAALTIRPMDIKPHWVTVPLLYSYARWSNHLVAGVR